MVKIMIIESEVIIENYLVQGDIIKAKEFKKNNKSGMILKGNLNVDESEYLLDLAKECEIVILRANQGEEEMVMSFGHKLRNKTNFTEIIFIANSAKYAVLGYDVGAVAYVPFIEYPKNLKKIIINTIKSIAKKNMTCVAIEYNKEIVRIPCRDIIYIESSKNIVSIYTDYGVFKDRRKLNEYDAVLEDVKMYLRIHQSFAVNLSYSYKFERTGITLFDKTVLPISRSRYDGVYKILSQFAKHMVLHEDFFE